MRTSGRWRTIALIATAIIDDNNPEMSIICVLIGLLVIIKHHRNIGQAWRELRHRDVETTTSSGTGDPQA